MGVKKDQVFLVQGQYARLVNEVPQLSATIEQLVVVASDDKAAYGLLEAHEPSFKPTGHATLQDYENAASRLRAVLKGESTEWKIIVEPGLVG